jgi:RNA polymerase sigma factor (TIGR02999 family)
MPDETGEISRILRAAAAGDAADLGELFTAVYAELRAMAGRHMAGERAGHTLQATALVNEAYLRLVGRGPVDWRSRGHFYAAAAEAMRRILVEHARARGRVKRGGGRVRLPVDLADLAERDDPDEILAIDDAIRRLEEQDELAARVVRLRFYAGLDHAETAAALGIAERRVRREWSFARVRLFRMLGGESRGEGP